MLHRPPAPPACGRPASPARRAARPVAMAALVASALLGTVAALIPPLAAAAVAVRAPAEIGAPDLRPRFSSVPGIPRGVVAALAQDRQGFVWVATGDGVMRYDGYALRAQERAEGEPGQRNLGWVRALLGSRDGRMWIGTESAGVVVHEPRSGRIEPVGPAATDATGVTGVTGVPGGAGAAGATGPSGSAARPTVTALAEDAEGAVWVGLMGAGLERIDPRTRAVTAFRADGRPGSLPDDRVWALAVDAEGGLWIGTERGLAWRRRGSERFEAVATPLGPQRVQALALAADGRLWAGSQRGDLLWVEPAATAVPAVRLLPREAELAPGALGAVTALAQDPSGRIWVGRAAGIDLHDPATGHCLEVLRPDPRQADGLGGSEVSSLLRDHAGGIWVGGLGGGLQRHAAPTPGLRVLGPTPAADSAWAEPDIRSLLVRPDGEVWAGTHDRGLVVLDAALRRARPLFAASSPSGVPGGAGDVAALRAEAMAQAADGSVWVAGDGALQQFGAQRQRLRRIELAVGRVWRVLAAADGGLWLATDAGLHRLAPGAAAPQRVAAAEGMAPADNIFALALAPDGGLWAGGTQGLFHVPPGSDRLHPVRTPPGAGLGNPTVIGLLVDAAGVLWVDTAVSGLHRLRRPPAAPATGPGAGAGERPLAFDRIAFDRIAFDRISERHGTVGRPFGVNLLQDGRGRIWSHMHVYDPATDRLHELTPADGVQFGTGWFGSYGQLPDGRLLFGGSRGLLVVDAASWDVPTAMPPLALTAWRIDGQPRPVTLAGADAAQAGDSAGGPGRPGPLVLAPGERGFSVEFAALDYVQPARIRYAWRLDGYDDDWVRSGAELRTASYGNLPPGEYLLRVRASNAAGVWGERELQLPVQVQPAWWQRRGLHLLAALLALGAVVFALQRHTGALRRRQLALEAEVQRRTGELQALTQALQRESRALEEASLTDPLTGLRNRRYLAQHIEADAALAVRRHEGLRGAGGRPAAGSGAAPMSAPGSAPAARPGVDVDLVFFLVDIDRFKQVNDRHGHAGGDAVLVQMRARLQAVFRDTDHIVRWGGEEFLVVARGTTRSHAAELAERLRSAVAGTPFTLADGTALACSCSIGFCAFPLAPALPRALDWSATLRLADEALYLVKSGGRDGWLGLVQAEAGDEAALHRAAAGGIEAWQAAGGLTLRRSTAKADGRAGEPGALR